MLRRLRENGPVLLVPLAWTFATAAHLGLLATRPVLIGHLVMDVVLVAFAALSWTEMRRGVLLAWKVVLLVGLGFTLLGTATLFASPDASALLRLTVLGWMLVPAAGLAYTGRHVAAARAPWVYTGGAGLSVVGAAAYLVAPALGTPPLAVTGLVLVGGGQTAGIVNAVYQY
ncbi:MAG: hypothetical protein V5A62_02560 [Haloarculaceae archaeon]